MAKACPIDLDRKHLSDKVGTTYTKLVESPEGDFHFNYGIDYACDLLGYDRAELESLPKECTARFAGLGNPLDIGPIHPGETVLDIGSGAGTDLLLAARRTGPKGKAIGVDPTAAMREHAARYAAAAGLSEIVELREGLSDALPADDAAVDVVITNGVVNLAPDKTKVFAEIARVLKPEGRLYLADVVLDEELSETSRRDADLWAA